MYLDYGEWSCLINDHFEGVLFLHFMGGLYLLIDSHYTEEILVSAKFMSTSVVI